MKVPSFPVETLGAIFAYVEDPSDLSTLSRTNKTFQRIAESILYRSVTLRGVPILGFCNAVVTRPHRAAAVRAINFFTWDDDRTSGLNMSSLHIIAAALRATHGLRELTLWLHPGLDYPGGTVLQDPCPFRLRRFVTNIACGSQLTSFLEEQTSLQDLCLAGAGCMLQEMNSIPHTAIPNLRSLAGFRGSIKHIMPNRPITQVTLQDPIGVSSIDEDLAMLMGSTAELTSLSAHTYDIDANFFTRLATSFPKLQYICLADVWGRAPGPGPLFQWSTALRDLKHLDTLHYKTDIRGGEGPERELVTHWSKHCPTLDCVIFSENRERGWRSYWSKSDGGNWDCIFEPDCIF